MRYIVFSFGLLIIALPTFAQSVGTDSISSTKTLDEVMVTASNIYNPQNEMLPFHKTKCSETQNEASSL